MRHDVFASSIMAAPLMLALLNVNYVVHGLSTPTELSKYLFYTGLTVFAGVAASFFVDEDNLFDWSVLSGFIRWVSAGVLFLGARLLAYATGNDPLVSWKLILSLMYLVELPLMIGSYFIGAQIVQH